MSTSSAHRPHPTRTHARPGPASRHVGHAVGAAVDVAILYLLNRSPGWEAVPFLTDDMTRVIGVVNLSILTGLLVNLVCVVWDPEWFKALGDLLTTCVGMLAMLRIWQVWPFDVPPGWPWDVLLHVVVALGVFGGVVGIIDATVRYVRAVGLGPR